MRTSFAILAVATALFAPLVAQAADTPPQGMPLTKGDTNPAGDYATHYTYGAPLATYSTNPSGTASAPPPPVYPGKNDAPVAAGQGSNGLPLGVSPDSSQPSK